MHNKSDSSVPLERLLIQAIALKRTVSATYNGGELELAPHRLFTRHGSLYVSALNTRRNWRSEEDKRLGHYKLDGLSNVRPEETSFEPLPDFDGTLPHEADEEVFSI